MPARDASARQRVAGTRAIPNRADERFVAAACAVASGRARSRPLNRSIHPTSAVSHTLNCELRVYLRDEYLRESRVRGRGPELKT